MTLIRYIGKKFAPATVRVIDSANDILDEYAAQGFDLTLRQLYYQFVARGMIRNKQSEYNRLGSIVNDARMAGLIDWDSIVDRTRELRDSPSWESPQTIVEAVSKQFRVDRWKDQPEYVEVWIEKDALVGVIAGVCDELRVPYFSCRGYTSQSEMWSASQRLGTKITEGHKVTLLHLGDHDPSGIDMTRDIRDRLSRFIATDWYQALDDDAIGHTEAWRYVRDSFNVDRIALTMDQVDEHDPPPNPAKLTDSRASGYVEAYGYESWELDALDPTTLATLIRSHVMDKIDDDLWEASRVVEQEGRRQLRVVAKDWTSLWDERYD